MLSQLSYRVCDAAWLHHVITLCRREWFSGHSSAYHCRMHVWNGNMFKSCVFITLSNSDLFVEGVAAEEGPFYFHPGLSLNHCVVGYCIVWHNNWLPTFRKKEWIRSRRMQKHTLSIKITQWTLIWETPVVNLWVMYLLLIWLKDISAYVNAEGDFSLSSSFRLSRCDIKMPWI
jgi:hypothetical protein